MKKSGLRQRHSRPPRRRKARQPPVPDPGERPADARLEAELVSRQADPRPREDASVEDPLFDEGGAETSDGLDPWLSEPDAGNTRP